ncbi:MAG: DUF554 domain-containing protein [Clostridia bacterium]|nr:DUF554 domain-containing protein [Clostridia bacterium]
MLGTIVNTGAVLAGTAAGLLLKKGIPERFSDSIVKTLGLATLVLGFGGVMAEMLKADSKGSLSTQNVMLLILSLVAGAVVGELIDIDKWLNRLGAWLQRRFKSKNGSFAEGFVTASLIYCVGAMAIVGSLQDGLAGDPTILYEKSILDGVMSVLLASTLGAGVAFSAVVVFGYQGLITLCALMLRPFLTAVVLAQMSMVGSALIICIGLNLLKVTKIKTANLIPAAFMPIIYMIVTNLCTK